MRAHRVAVALTWLLALAAVLWVARATSVGPVLLAIDPPDHGVHLGDAAALLDAAVVAGLLTVVGRQRRNRRATCE